MALSQEDKEEFREKRDAAAKKARDAMAEYVKQKSKLDHGDPTVVSPIKLAELKKEAQEYREQETVWDDRYNGRPQKQRPPKDD